MALEIYQCMDCGERWTHGGVETFYNEALAHQGPEHHVLIGEIDVLARHRERYLAERDLVRANKQQLRAAIAGQFATQDVDRAVDALLGVNVLPHQVPDPEHPEIAPGGKVEEW